MGADYPPDWSKFRSLPPPVRLVRRVCTTYRQKTLAIVMGQEGN